MHNKTAMTAKGTGRRIVKKYKYLMEASADPKVRVKDIKKRAAKSKIETFNKTRDDGYAKIEESSRPKNVKKALKARFKQKYLQSVKDRTESSYKRGVKRLEKIINK